MRNESERERESKRKARKREGKLAKERKENEMFNRKDFLGLGIL